MEVAVYRVCICGRMDTWQEEKETGNQENRKRYKK